MADTGGIKVISKAAAILRLCKDSNSGFSLSDIAERIGVPRSTVQRIVGALVKEGLLQTTGAAKGIKLGPEIHALSAAQQVDVIELAHPFLKKLSEQTGETIDLAKLKGDHMIFVDQVVGSHRLRAISSVGEIFPLHNTANGKAALSLLHDDDVKDLLSPPKFQHIKSEISQIRQSGIAIDNEDHSPGICAIGTAFTISTGEIYALSIPMPAIRFNAQTLPFKLELLATRDAIVQACEKPTAEAGLFSSSQNLR
jgi:DNA-binding IclR family transcriptional regulator